MKKFLAIMLTVLCICTLGVAAIDGQGDSTTSDNTDVLYEVTEGYTWNIHAAINFGKDAAIDGSNSGSDKTGHLVIEDQAVAVTKNIIRDGKKLKISIGAYSCDSEGVKKTDNVFQVANGNSQLAYSVVGKTGDFKEGAIAIGNTILEVAAGVNTGAEHMTFTLDTSKLAGAAQNLASEVAGNYYGKVVYTAQIVAASV